MRQRSFNRFWNVPGSVDGNRPTKPALHANFGIDFESLKHPALIDLDLAFADRTSGGKQLACGSKRDRDVPAWRAQCQRQHVRPLGTTPRFPVGRHRRHHAKRNFDRTLESQHRAVVLGREHDRLQEQVPVGQRSQAESDDVRDPSIGTPVPPLTPEDASAPVQNAPVLQYLASFHA